MNKLECITGLIAVTLGCILTALYISDVIIYLSIVFLFCFGGVLAFDGIRDKN